MVEVEFCTIIHSSNYWCSNAFICNTKSSSKYLKHYIPSICKCKINSRYLLYNDFGRPSFLTDEWCLSPMLVVSQCVSAKIWYFCCYFYHVIHYNTNNEITTRVKRTFPATAISFHWSVTHQAIMNQNIHAQCQLTPTNTNAKNN